MPPASPAVFFLALDTDSIARSAERRYSSYSEGDFEAFRPILDGLLNSFMMKRKLGRLNVKNEYLPTSAVAVAWIG